MGKRQNGARYGKCNVQYGGRLGSPPTQKQPLANSLWWPLLIFQGHPWFRPLDLSKNQKEKLQTVHSNPGTSERLWIPWEFESFKPWEIIWIRHDVVPISGCSWALLSQPLTVTIGTACNLDGSVDKRGCTPYSVQQGSSEHVLFVTFRILVPVLVVGGALGFLFFFFQLDFSEVWPSRKWCTRLYALQV